MQIPEFPDAEKSQILEAPFLIVNELGRDATRDLQRKSTFSRSLGMSTDGMGKLLHQFIRSYHFPGPSKHHFLLHIGRSQIVLERLH